MARGPDQGWEALRLRVEGRGPGPRGKGPGVRGTSPARCLEACSGVWVQPGLQRGSAGHTGPRCLLERGTGSPVEGWLRGGVRGAGRRRCCSWVAGWPTERTEGPQGILHEPGRGETVAMACSGAAWAEQAWACG